MLDFLVELSRWYNLLFALPVFIIVIYQFLHTLAIFDIGSVDTAFGDLGAIAADKLSQSTSSSFLRRFLIFLNVGQIPWLIIVVTFLLSWGMVGLVCNHLFIPLFANFALPAVLISFFIALMIGSVITRLTSQGIALAFPTSEKDELRRADLVGATGTVTSSKVSPKFGMARTEGLPFHVTIFCRVDEGEEHIKHGEKIIIWDYNPNTHLYKVQALDER